MFCVWTNGAIAAAPGKVVSGREICFLWVTFHSDPVVWWKAGLFSGFQHPFAHLLSKGVHQSHQRCSTGSVRKGIGEGG